MVRYFDHPDLPRPHGYRHAALSGTGLIHTAGQTYSSADSESLFDVSLTAQVEGATVNAMTALAGAGGRPERILSLEVFVVGLGPETVDDVYAGIGKAARQTGFGRVPITILGISALTAPGALAEVRAIGTAVDRGESDLPLG